MQQITWKNCEVIDVSTIDFQTMQTLSRQTTSSIINERRCQHLGPDTGEKVKCPTCVGNVEVKLRECDIYSACTTHKQVSGYSCCMQCPSYLQSGLISGTITNLPPMMQLILPQEQSFAFSNPLMGAGATESFPFCGCCTRSNISGFCCSGTSIPTTLFLHYSGGFFTGPATCFSGVMPNPVELDYNATDLKWESSLITDPTTGCTIQWLLSCQFGGTGTGQFVLQCGPAGSSLGGGNSQNMITSCSPFRLSFTANYALMGTVITGNCVNCSLSAIAGSPSVPITITPD